MFKSKLKITDELDLKSQCGKGRKESSSPYWFLLISFELSLFLSQPNTRCLFHDERCGVRLGRSPTRLGADSSSSCSKARNKPVATADERSAYCQDLNGNGNVTDRWKWQRRPRQASHVPSFATWTWSTSVDAHWGNVEFDVSNQFVQLPCCFPTSNFRTELEETDLIFICRCLVNGCPGID